MPLGDTTASGRPPTRVLLVAQQLRRPVPGGIGTYVRGLLQGLGSLNGIHPGRRADERPSVTLYAGRPPAHPDPLLALGHPVRTSPLPAVALTRLWDLSVLGVPRGFDVVHAPSLDAPPARRRPLVVTVHDLAWREIPDAFPGRGRRWHEAAFRRVVSRADALIVPSASVADALSDALSGTLSGTLSGSPSDPGSARAGDVDVAQRVRVIPHGSDHLPPPDDAAATALLARLEVGGDFVLAVGTLEPRKNLARLLAAFEHASRSWSEPLSLLVVGPPGWGDGAAAASPGPSRVRPAGPVPPALLTALYRRARLLAFVPLLEGFGLPPLEAMAQGTPVLSSPVPSIGDAAWVVDPRDIDSITDGLIRVATDDELRRRLSQAGKAHAAAHTWAASAARHLQVWESFS